MPESLGQRVEPQKIFRQPDGHFGSARETRTDLIQLRTDLDQAREHGVLLSFKGFLIRSQCRNEAVDSLLPGMPKAPNPLINVNLLIEADARLIMALPGYAAPYVQLPAHQPNTRPGSRQRAAIEQRPVGRQIADTNGKRRGTCNE